MKNIHHSFELLYHITYLKFLSVTYIHTLPYTTVTASRFLCYRKEPNKQGEELYQTMDNDIVIRHNHSDQHMVA